MDFDVGSVVKVMDQLMQDLGFGGGYVAQVSCIASMSDPFHHQKVAWNISHTRCDSSKISQIPANNFERAATSAAEL